MKEKKERKKEEGKEGGREGERKQDVGSDRSPGKRLIRF